MVFVLNGAVDTNFYRRMKATVPGAMRGIEVVGIE